MSMWTIVLRSLRIWKRDINLLLCGFYWPLLDIIIWGFVGSWIQSLQAAEFSNYKATALMGVLLWQVVGRGANFIVFSISEDLWNNNLVNLFSLPLRLLEWICGVIAFFIIMNFITNAFCIVMASLFYDISFGYLFMTFLLFLLPLIFSTIWIGFMCLSIIALFGKRGIEMGFIIGWLLMPFSGAYYPVEILPQWAQAFSSCLPMSYVFQGMRAYMMHNQNPVKFLIQGTIMAIIYALISIIIFIYCFNYSKQKGLARLAD